MRPIRKKIYKESLLLMGVPASYVGANLKEYNQDSGIKELVHRYVKDLDIMLRDRICMIFYGANGTGKTYLSSYILKEAYRKRYRAHMTTLAHYMELSFKKEKSYEHKEELRLIRQAELLVLDEVGKENFTQSQSNISLLEDLLRQAVTNGQSIILCTNLPLEGEQGLYSLYGKSIESLVNGDCVKVKFRTNDYRPSILKKKEGIRLLTDI